MTFLLHNLAFVGSCNQSLSVKWVIRLAKFLNRKPAILVQFIAPSPRLFVLTFVWPSQSFSSLLRAKLIFHSSTCCKKIYSNSYEVWKTDFWQTQKKNSNSCIKTPMGILFSLYEAGQDWPYLKLWQLQAIGIYFSWSVPVLMLPIYWSHVFVCPERQSSFDLQNIFACFFVYLVPVSTR